jgi:hypothetical protein
MENIKNSIQNIQMPTTEKIGEGINNTIQSIGESISNTQQSISDGLKSFSSPADVNASPDYLNTNGIVAKFAFVLFMVLVFILLLNIGTSLIIFFTQQSKNPYVVKGLVNGNVPIEISQDPKKDGSITIYRSNNQSKGLECTWSCWIKIDNLKGGSPNPNYNHIFHKGNNRYTDSGTTGIATVNNAPGVYVKSDNNELRIYYDSFSSNPEYVDISNIPIKKWFLLNIRIQNMSLDTYINGSIVSRKTYTSVPKQNYDSIFLGQNGGFGGSVSNLRYYPYALSVFEMNNILLQGPNFINIEQDGKGIYTYLSNMWYMSKLS